MDNRLRKFIEWAVTSNQKFGHVKGMTEEHYKDLEIMMEKYESIQNIQPVKRDTFLASMLDAPIFKFIPPRETVSRIYQYCSQSRKYMLNVEDLVVYQGFNGEYYHWISRVEFEKDIANRYRNEKNVLWIK